MRLLNEQLTVSARTIHRFLSAAAWNYNEWNLKRKVFVDMSPAILVGVHCWEMDANNELRCVENFNPEFDMEAICAALDLDYRNTVAELEGLK